MATQVNLTKVLGDITTGLQMLNVVEPDIQAIIDLFTGTKQTVESMLSDATTVETADEASIKTELGS